jgi:TonB family protein
VTPSAIRFITNGSYPMKLVRGIPFFFLLAAALPAIAAEATSKSAPDLSDVDSAPLIRDWAPAKFPTAVPNDVVAGTAVVRVTVDETGAITAARVLEASQPPFGDAALAAVKQWSFSPAQHNRQKVAMCLDVPFEFDREHPARKGVLPEERLLPTASPRTDANAEETPLDEYPDSLRGRGLPGVITFRCHVNADGTCANFRVLTSSHADLVVPVLRSVKHWTFTPGKQGDLNIGADLVGEVSFRDANAPSRDEVLRVNGITARDGSAPDPSPRVVSLPEPVYPYEELLAGEAGSATIDFVVMANGTVGEAHVRDATKPAFGAAALAAVEASFFEGAKDHGVGVDVPLTRKFDFGAIAADAKDPGEGLVHLVTLARAKAIGTAKGLDAKITPVYRMMPVKPRSVAEDEKGQATIEFTIDRDGRGRMPRIVSATKPELGWSAATAVSQWVFNVPTRGGQPTEVRVQVPFAF